MKVSGFTFIRNAIQYDFPIVEAVNSVLPIVDEFVVNVGRSDDDTLGLIESIGSEKIRIVESVWDDSLRKDGRIFGIQQDVALSHCMGDWALLVQGDEVLHEDDYQAIREALYTYAVLVFHNQDVTDQQHVAFSEGFGPLEMTMVSDPIGDGGPIGIISNVDELSLIHI